MKRHLRIVIDNDSLIGRALQESAWFPSDEIMDVKLNSYNLSYVAGEAFGSRVSVMLGFEWTPWQSSFVRFRYIQDQLVDILSASPKWDWIDQNASGSWLVSIRIYHDSLGYNKYCARIWFEREDDAVLFKIRGFV